MHHPLQVLILGIVGLAINGVVFCLIGGEAISLSVILRFLVSIFLINYRILYPFLAIQFMISHTVSISSDFPFESRIIFTYLLMLIYISTYIRVSLWQQDTRTTKDVS